MTRDAGANGHGEGKANGKEKANGKKKATTSARSGGADHHQSSAVAAPATSPDTSNGSTRTRTNSDDSGQRGGHGRGGTMPSPSSSSSSSSSLSTLACVVIAAVSFSVGVLTPPLLEIYEDRLPTQARTVVARYLHSNGRSSERANDGIVDDGAAPSWQDGRRRGGGRKSGGGPSSFFPCTTENLAQFLHDEPVSGLHVACVSRDGGGDGEEDASLSVSLHRGACSTPDDLDGSREGGGGACPPPETVSLEDRWPALRDAFVDLLNLESPPEGKRERMRRWQIYTPDGVRIVGASDKGGGDNSLVRRAEILGGILNSEMVIIVKGGTWIWPGVRIGYERTISLSGSIMEGGSSGGRGRNSTDGTDGLVATLKTLSLKPLVLSVSEFLTTDECDYIQEKAAPHMQYSGVSLKDADKGKQASEWRTSQTYFMRAREHEKLRRLDDRVATLTRIPRRHQEDIQVLRYGYEEKYDQHHDFFDPSHYANSPDILRMIQNGERNRLATVFWYLSDVEEGGETIFPREGGVVRRVSFSDCTVGLKVKPEKRKVIIFYSMRHDGELDDYSLHGACPVKKGIKWAANKWVWSAPMNFVS